MTEDLRKTFSSSHRLFMPLLKSRAMEIIGLFLFCDLFDQYFKFMGQFMKGAGGVNLPALFGRFTVSLLLMVLLTHWVPLRTLQLEGQLSGETLWSFIMRHIRDFTLESLRAMGLVLLFSLLLLLPGIWKYVQFMLVPYVVLVDPAYKEGKVDALDESKRLMSGFVILGMILAISALPIVLFVGQWTEPILIYTDPLKWLLSFLVVSGSSYYLNLLLFQFYRVRKSSLGGTSGSNV